MTLWDDAGELASVECLGTPGGTGRESLHYAIRKMLYMRLRRERARAAKRTAERPKAQRTTRRTGGQQRQPRPLLAPCEVHVPRAAFALAPLVCPKAVHRPSRVEPSDRPRKRLVLMGRKPGAAAADPPEASEVPEASAPRRPAPEEVPGALRSCARRRPRWRLRARTEPHPPGSGRGLGEPAGAEGGGGELLWPGAAQQLGLPTGPRRSAPARPRPRRAGLAAGRREAGGARGQGEEMKHVKDKPRSITPSAAAGLQQLADPNIKSVISGTIESAAAEAPQRMAEYEALCTNRSGQAYQSEYKAFQRWTGSKRNKRNPLPPFLAGLWSKAVEAKMKPAMFKLYFMTFGEHSKMTCLVTAQYQKLSSKEMKHVKDKPRGITPSAAAGLQQLAEPLTTSCMGVCPAASSEGRSDDAEGPRESDPSGSARDVTEDLRPCSPLAKMAADGYANVAHSTSSKVASEPRTGWPGPPPACAPEQDPATPHRAASSKAEPSSPRSSSHGKTAVEVFVSKLAPLLQGYLGAAPSQSPAERASASSSLKAAAADSEEASGSTADAVPEGEGPTLPLALGDEREQEAPPENDATSPAGLAREFSCLRRLADLHRLQFPILEGLVQERETADGRRHRSGALPASAARTPGTRCRKRAQTAKPKRKAGRRKGELCAYNFYVKEKFRDHLHEGASARDIMKVVGPEWLALAAEDRKKYDVLAAECKKRVEERERAQSQLLAITESQDAAHGPVCAQSPLQAAAKDSAPLQAAAEDPPLAQSPHQPAADDPVSARANAEETVCEATSEDPVCAQSPLQAAAEDPALAQSPLQPAADDPVSAQGQCRANAEEPVCEADAVTQAEKNTEDGQLDAG